MNGRDGIGQHWQSKESFSFNNFLTHKTEKMTELANTIGKQNGLSQEGIDYMIEVVNTLISMGMTPESILGQGYQASMTQFAAKQYSDFKWMENFGKSVAGFNQLKALCEA